MNYLTDREKFTKIYELDWEKYNNFVYDSMSLHYFLKDQLEIDSNKPVNALLGVSEEDKVVYVPIPKNASSSIKASLNLTPIETYFKKTYIENETDSGLLKPVKSYLDIPKKYRTGYKFFVVTRDPKERWISGINQFLDENLGYLYYGTNTNNINDSEYHKKFRSKFINELKDNKFIFHCDTRPQVSWINFCSQYDLDITFLKLDENLDEKISNILKRKVTIKKENTTKNNVFKLKNYKFCHDILTKYCMKNKNFLDLFEMDFYLYERSS